MLRNRCRSGDFTNDDAVLLVRAFGADVNAAKPLDGPVHLSRPHSQGLVDRRGRVKSVNIRVVGA